LQPSLRGYTHFAREIFEISKLDVINTAAARLAAVLVGEILATDYGARERSALAFLYE